MIGLYITIGFLLALSLTLGYVIIINLQKLESYEDFIEKEIDRNEALLEALRQIDQRQMFEKDDDVGSIFYQIKETIERFKQFN
jgi:Glu-tRNA(Gln) amidotransferase subunit E-like FAD-binding protein